MHLKCIKLAGFKSFVDPTTISFPSRLCAIVGPNGCGKSNVIDAVRWVMGERSAKPLRGESMADVIFNGSGGRQPVGQASIELIFDNANGGLGGEYAAYAEISIRRKVTRDGQSQYYLNGGKCRRRDITDVFLGTGLGPRSYAIIEQGMISSLVESRPEDLRVYLEEAAGISKYKERRKDTESRIASTQENLARLTDIRDELGRQLQRLERQVQTAEKYVAHKKEERQLKAEWLALRWRALDRQMSVQRQQIGRAELAAEALVTARQGCETALEKHRVQYSDQSAAFNQTQGRYYAIGAEVARIEQAIQHAGKRVRELDSDLQQTVRNHDESAAHLRSDQQKAVGWQAELAELAPALHQARGRETASSAELQAAEAATQALQTTWDEFNQRAAAPRRQAEVQQARSQQIEQTARRLAERQARLSDELVRLDASALTAEVAALTQQLAELETQGAGQQSALQPLAAAIDAGRKAIVGIAQSLGGAREQVQKLRGRQASLEALQQAALGDQAARTRWLADRQLSARPRLTDSIEVVESWETAVETVLGDWLQAVCVEALEPLAAALGSFQAGELVLVDNASPAPGAPADPVDGIPLAAKVTGTAGALLSGIYAAASLDEALALRPRLARGQSVVTPDGLWFGPNWVRVARDQGGVSGVLQRKRELAELGTQIVAAQAAVATLTQQQSAAQAELAAREQRREDLAAAVARHQRQYADLRAKLSARRMQVEQLANRSQQLERELTEINGQQEQERQHLTEARELLSQALVAMAADNQRKDELVRERDQQRAALDHARARARRDREQAHELAVREKAVGAQLASIRDGIARLAGQVARLAERRAEIEASIAAQLDPNAELQRNLTTQLDLRLRAETEVADARRAVEAIEQELHALEQQRSQLDGQLQDQRAQLEQQRLAARDVETRGATLLEQLAELDAAPGPLLAALAEEADPAAWETSLAQVGERIRRLGPINLAALDEYQVAAERKTYLDTQHAELVDALTTLEDAIRRIDRETRTRFRDTFEQVNQSLQRLFPKLFGGGNAYLELTGDDLLNTGVTIMARPPGKKNSTIHLLSGGEKALTAIALVFAIFQLNPAPFCMLDEVDAPLDDANVGRFAQLVKEMSAQVQFIYISHNKIAMEMAHQLLGVTMNEPGVSRLVSVDVDTASQMAQPQVEPGQRHARP